MTDVLGGIEWKPDCQGKQDFDSDLLSLSCRFYPRGGGFSVLDTGTGEWFHNDSRPHIRPAAACSIIWRDEVYLAKAFFEADTEHEVKAMVEGWAREHIKAALTSLREAFGVST